MMHRLDRIVTSLMAVIEALLDAAVTRYGRMYIAAASVLISLVAVVFFAAVIPEVRRARIMDPAPIQLLSCRIST